MKRAPIFSLLAAILLPLVLASYTPFRGTVLERSSKLENWWKDACRHKYYNVDFNKFKFLDISRMISERDTSAIRKAGNLLSRVPARARSRRWVAAFDNRGQFCGLVSEDMIIADAGRKSKNGKEVYVNMLLNSVHLPSALYLVDNISYYTDSKGRIKRVYCPDLKLKARGRNQSSQKYSVKFKDGVSGDNCGHLIPQALDGPAEQINFVPQRRDLNSGEILELEKKAINAVKQGHKVSYEIKILYHGDEKRPYGFENNVKVYDRKGKIIRNYTGMFDNSPKNGGKNRYN
ncbi:MAG: DNA/RNA non-specific endonuclease [Bacteroidales bacterium]|nr:DNA/RNA non-specific endonuclease [Bacteroidales bacterium]